MNVIIVNLCTHQKNVDSANIVLHYSKEQLCSQLLFFSFFYHFVLRNVWNKSVTFPQIGLGSVMMVCYYYVEASS